MRNADGPAMETLYSCECGKILGENSVGVICLETIEYFCPFCGSRKLTEIKE